jgi:hypothetical protein
LPFFANAQLFSTPSASEGIECSIINVNEGRVYDPLAGARGTHILSIRFPRWWRTSPMRDEAFGLIKCDLPVRLVLTDTKVSAKIQAGLEAAYDSSKCSRGVCNGRSVW